MGSRLIDSLATTDELADLFSDASVLQAMLDFEAALARAAARAGAIPEQAALAIAAAARAEHFDAAAIAREARETATPSIPLVNALTARVGSADPESARYVHWGATSQDVSDSALILLLRRAHRLLTDDHARLADVLRDISDQHASSVMLGRTLLQPATPITFGLKVAGWRAPLIRSWKRLTGAWEAALVIELGGAAGTRAALGPHASAIPGLLAEELGLGTALPWHTDRDRLGAIITGCGLYIAALGKIARDLALLMQPEVGEAAEDGRGSSTMPHKRNPAGCAVALAAATRMPALVAAFLSGAVQEHERSVGGGHAEWPTIAAAVQTTGVAVSSMASVMESLTVDPARMRANLEATGGVIFAERAVMLLTARLGRESARRVITDTIRRTRETGRRFGETLRESLDVVQSGAVDDLLDIEDAELYLGEAESIRRQLLSD